MSKHIKSLSVFLCLMLFCVAALADTEEQTKLYPLPLAEVDEVISQWLADSGFLFNRSFSGAGEIEFNAVGTKDNWHIFLKQNSALATEVQALWTSGEAPGELLFSNLYTHISDYITPHFHEQAAKKQGLENDIPALVLARIGSVVCVRAKAGDREVQYSGFVVDPGGLILCTAHDLEDCRELTVSFYDGRKAAGHILKADLDRDLTLIRVGVTLNAHVSLSGGRALLDMNERIFSIGCPLNLLGSVFPGVVNGPLRRANGQLLWQVNMKIFHGSSGSPVFDAKGNLVAVVKGRYRGSDSVGFLIPLGTVREFMEERF